MPDNSQTEKEIERTAALVGLLKDYARKLERLANDARSLTDEILKMREKPDDKVARDVKQGTAQALHFRVNHLSQKVNDVARRASALVEHSLKDEIAKLELSLILADIESVAQYAQQLTIAALNIR